MNASRCRRLQWLVPLVACWSAGAGGPAIGAPAAAAVEVEAVGTCPAREAVATALSPLLGREPAAPLSAAPRVVDLGEGFEVFAAGQRGRYTDTARDCSERARIAAVFIGLALNPPAFETPPPPPPPSVVVPPPEQPPTVVASPEPPLGPDETAAPLWAAVGLSARVDGSSLGNDPADTKVVAGGELRAAIGRRWLGIVATAGVLSPTTARFTTVPVRQQRFPVSVGLTATAGAAGGFQLAGDLAAVLVPFTSRGQGLESSTSELRLDAGARLALALRFPKVANRAVLFSELHAEVFPRPYHLDVDPIGPIGNTSRLWLGAAVGAWFGGP